MDQITDYGKTRMRLVENFEFPEHATPIADCSELIPMNVHNLNELNRVESENIISAQKKYLRAPIENPKKWFQVVHLKNIHRAMFKEVWQWAGHYRKSITSIGIKPNLIPMQLSEFCHEVLSWLKFPVELTFIEMAARIHHRLVLIHPFENGNGRFSRLVADRFLLSFRCTYPLWPYHLNQEGIVRKEYIETLKSADQRDYTPLIELMKKLGASDPKLTEFFKSNFYRRYLKSEHGPALVKALLNNGDNPNSETPSGHRLLQLAIKLDLNEIVKHLVNAGAEIDVRDRSGLTPLQVAAKHKNSILIDFLLSKNATSSV